jgi:hypothetical protein
MTDFERSSEQLVSFLFGCRASGAALESLSLSRPALADVLRVTDEEGGSSCSRGSTKGCALTCIGS